MPASPARNTASTIDTPCDASIENAQSSASDWLPALLCALALVCAQSRTWLLNYSIFPITSLVFPWAREFQTLVAPLVGLIVIAVVIRKPALIRPGAMVGGAAACSVAAALVLLTACENALGVSLGCVLHSCAGVWGFYFIGIALAGLETGGLTAAAIVGGTFAAKVVSTFVPAPGYTTAVVVAAALALLPYALLWKRAVPTLRLIARSQNMLDLSLANPQSYIAPFHQVYVLIFIFAGANGLALAFNDTQHTPVLSYLPFVVLGIIALWLLATRRNTGHEDALFAGATLLTMAGLLAAIIEPFLVVEMSNGLLSAGSVCFSMLLWMSLAALCRRNPVSSLYVLACGSITQSIGMLVGANVGHTLNTFIPHNAGPALVTLCAVVLGFFAYVLLGLRDFSFSRTIRGVMPAVEVAPHETTPSREELIEVACTRLGAEHGITDRERDFVRLLTYGYSGKRIQEELGVSYNTVKTHAKHIYRKLDVHSQQELIDLVERRMEG